MVLKGRIQGTGGPGRSGNRDDRCGAGAGGRNRTGGGFHRSARYPRAVARGEDPRGGARAARHARVLDRSREPLSQAAVQREPHRFIFYCNLGWRSALAAQVAQVMGLTERLPPRRRFRRHGARPAAPWKRSPESSQEGRCTDLQNRRWLPGIRTLWPWSSRCSSRCWASPRSTGMSGWPR
ncbi:MAG: hypothetical protein MZU79_01155 [Anaerotruncus sp.]|nr:hypothetical protein [Anaerotruncus sp.]